MHRTIVRDPPGYTYFNETGTADIGNIEFDDTDDSVTVDIDFIDPDSTIEIHYGAYEGDDDDGSGAVAPSAATTSSVFSISVKGGDATTIELDPIKTLKGGPIVVPVYSQASGGGNVSAVCQTTRVMMSVPVILRTVKSQLSIPLPVK